jgi:hypothetical protein
MCPACLASLALTVAGATSAGGVIALAAHKLLVNSRAKEPRTKETSP